MKAVVSLNSGSSSIKFALFTLDGAGAPVLSAGGKIEGIGIAPRLVARSVDGSVVLDRDWAGGAGLGHAALLEDLFGWAGEHLEGYEVLAIGHRVVHGGTDFAAPRQVDEALLAALETLCPLAPLHQPHNLAAIRAIAALRPDLPQIACFDTAFHHDRPELATRLAIPRELHAQGIRRYGFHGLSYEYIARRLAEIDPETAKGRVIAAHLGNGASLCAMRGGRSVDTTMGFTALDGLMMGTRCGSIDPGVVLHLQTRRVRCLQRHAGAFGKRVARRRGSGRAVRMARSARGGRADRLHRRARRARLHSRDRREPRSRARAYLRTLGVGRNRDRRQRERPQRGAHQHAGEPRRRVCDSDRRGTHDRAPHAERDKRRRVTLAETEGFEPSIRVNPVWRFSKPLVSATHPRLQPKARL